MTWSIKKSANLYKKVLLISAAGLIKVTFIELFLYVCVILILKSSSPYLQNILSAFLYVIASTKVENAGYHPVKS
jgi:hypothetical protein